MADTLMEHLVTKLQADVAVATLAADRIRKGHVSELVNPDYPLVSLTRVLPGRVDPDAPASVFSLQVIAWSDDNPEEAFELAEAVRAVLHQSNATVGAEAWYIEQDTTPIEYPDSEPATSYACHIMYHVRKIG